MSLMPCFGPNQAFAEGAAIGRLLAGYGEIEVQTCDCLVAVERILDVAVKKIFGTWRAQDRIKNIGAALQTDFANAGLLTDLTPALAVC